jgi:TgpA N-terminal domain/Transglutaminase-like superfamily
MSALPGDVRRDLPLALVAAATTWLTMLSWRGFTSDWGAFLLPLLLVAIVVALGGVALRAAPIPRRTGALLHVLVVALLVWLLIGGSLFHPFASSSTISLHIQDAWISAETFRPPIPTTEPSIAPLMIPCGALALLLVDLLACWLRRVPLAGLPLLAVYCVPISVIGDGVSPLLFLIAAAGYLLMLFLQESAHVARWGRPLAGGTADPTGFGVSNGASRGTAVTVGSIAAVLAVVLPLFIPTLHLDGLGLFGSGGHGGAGVHVANPITDMRRDLYRGTNVTLLDVQTNDPDPSYLRIAVLNDFDGLEWTTGSRAVISNQVANGLVPLEQGLAASVPLHAYNYRVTATDQFDSTWLPTEFPVSAVNAAGAWHYDATTMDFLNSEKQTTAGLSWTMTAAKPSLSAFDMKNSLTAPLAIQSTYIQLPSSVPSTIQRLAEAVTRGADSRFEQVRKLQDWFRSTGGFTYNLKNHRDDGNGTAALLHFLAPQLGVGGGSVPGDERQGYCEQFASAFAVMARELSIPTRVAVGFLDPTKVGHDQYQFKAYDLHAWPEVYFQGSGWVRFEPTPATRVGSAPPPYSVGAITKPGSGESNPAGGGHLPTETTSSAPVTHSTQHRTSTSSSGPSIPWIPILATLAAVVIGVAVALVPRALRRRRRTQRLAGLAEDAWAELRDTAVDLGVGWPFGRSPHETGHRLAGWFGYEPDGPPPIRPPRGRGLNPAAEYSLDQIVHSVERTRYARSADDAPGALAEHVEVCLAALRYGSTRGALRRAEWWPRSLFTQGGGAGGLGRSDREPEATSPGGVVDHVG